MKTGKPLPAPSMGNILGCALALFEKESKAKPSGINRLYRILISESAFLIWKLRNNSVITKDGAAPSEMEIRNKWVFALNDCLEVDCFQACNRSDQGKILVAPAVVLHTWSRTLQNEHKLPADWLREPRALYTPHNGEQKSTSKNKTVNAWRRKMPALIDVYLALKADGPLNSDDAPDSWPVFVIGFDDHRLHSFTHPPGCASANEALIRPGFIGASAVCPSLAFPLRLFEIYRELHRVCPRFSLNALSKSLTHLHSSPRKTSLQQQLTTTYNAYLAVVHGTDARRQVALGRTDEYKAGKVREDDRTMHDIHDRWLTPEAVDELKDAADIYLTCIRVNVPTKMTTPKGSQL
ncbi:hypothetical protein B0H17DRAFT_1214851 [Mycena rosella]|uniref:Uncharacterized protein n=1 Tax=Mycena rosella TaxID=1033263 RepID=A0AAD7CM80_MYCRO|nr:hypothetical protein B0H17DRAFT_1214851 [Mycena rosella]